MPKVKKTKVAKEQDRNATHSENTADNREEIIQEMRATGYDGSHFVDSVDMSTLNQMRRGRPARRNRYVHYCSWAYALMRNKIGPPEAEYSFPPAVLKFIRHLVPGDVKGEIRDHAYLVSMEEFCKAMELPALNVE